MSNFERCIVSLRLFTIVTFLICLFLARPKETYDLEVNLCRERMSIRLHQLVDDHHFYRSVSPHKLTEASQALQGLCDGESSGLARDFSRENEILAQLDPYSKVLNTMEWKNMMDSSQAEYKGFGLSLDFSELLPTVKRVYRSSPAQKQGILEGDKIIKIKGTPVFAKSSQDIISLLQKDTDQEVEFEIARKKQLMKLSIRRQEIKNESTEFKLIQTHPMDPSKSKTILVAKIFYFALNTADDFYDYYQKITAEQSIDGILIDLRDNPGGLFHEAIDFADLFLSHGNIVTSVENGRVTHYPASEQDEDIRGPVIVLQDGSSASASEIVAGALKESKRALLVGETTYGKSLIQNLYELPGKNGLKLSVGYYQFQPDAVIQGAGVAPHIALVPEDILNEDQWLEKEFDFFEIQHANVRSLKPRTQLFVSQDPEHWQDWALTLFDFVSKEHRNFDGKGVVDYVGSLENQNNPIMDSCVLIEPGIEKVHWQPEGLRIELKHAQPPCLVSGFQVRVDEERVDVALDPGEKWVDVPLAAAGRSSGQSMDPSKHQRNVEIFWVSFLPDRKLIDQYRVYGKNTKYHLHGLPPLQATLNIRNGSQPILEIADLETNLIEAEVYGFKDAKKKLQTLDRKISLPLNKDDYFESPDSIALGIRVQRQGSSQYLWLDQPKQKEEAMHAH